ncbi:phage tail tape measure protein [Pseudonocardia sp. T1-2H]|uniref:phage tail tape measure protein n=1 Tax=Pseudonocardia sp. T1-2H TaxID=3128899 RepID=UPI003100FF33
MLADQRAVASGAQTEAAQVTASAEEIAAAQKALALSYGEGATAAEMAASKTAAAYAAMSDKVVADLAAVKVAEAEAATANVAVGTTMAGTAAGMGTLSTASAAASASFGNVAAKVGLTSGQLGLAGLAAAAVGGVAVKMAGDFDMATTRLVTSANETESNLGMVRDGILAMAGTVGYSSDELAKAMYKVESGGQHGADGLKVLQAAAEGAKTENADLTVVADAVTTALIDYHLHADDAATVTSKMVQATASGKMTFEELAGSFSSVAPIASAANISLDDMLGVLASMTSHGISAQQATQNMADAIRHLQAPTGTMRNEMNLLGISADDVAAHLGERGLSGTMQLLQQAISKSMPPGSEKVFLDMKNAVASASPAVQDLAQKVMDGSISMKDFSKAAKDLDPISAKQAASFATLAGTTHQLGSESKTGEEVMQTYGGAMQKAMGDATGLKVALMTTGENADYTNNAIKGISGTTTEAGNHVKGWSEIQGEFNTKVSQAKDGIGALAISIGEKLLPVVTPIVGAIADFTTWITQNQVAATALAIVIGGVVVVAFSAAAVAAWSFTAALLANPVVWIVAAIVAAIGLLVFAVVEIVQHWQGIADFFSGLWSDVKDIFSSAVSWVGDKLSDLADFFSRMWGKVKDGLTSAKDWIKQKLSDVVDFFTSLPDKIGEGLSKVGESLKTSFSHVLDFITAPFRAAFAFVKLLFSKSPGEWGQIIGQALGQLARTLVDKGKALWHGFWDDGVVPAWNNTLAWFKALPGRIVDAIGAANTWLKQKGKDLWHGFWDDGVVPAWSNTLAWFKALPGRIVDGIGAANTWLNQKGKDLWHGFWDDGVVPAYNNTIAWFKALPGRIQTALGDAASWLTQKGKDLWHGFWDDGVVPAWNNTVAWFHDLPNKIHAFFTDAPHWLVEHGKMILQGLIDGITGFASKVYNAISDFIKGFIDGFKRGFGIASPSTIFHDFGIQILTGLLNGLTTMWTTVVGFLGRLPSQAINLFANAGSWLVSAGHNLLVGLWNGIASMTSWVWDKLTGWASSLWGGVKSALGIASPSTIAHESGMWLMKGLANGIDEHGHVAVQAAQAVADRVVTATKSTNQSLTGLGLTAATLGGDGASLSFGAAGFTRPAVPTSPGVLTGVGAGQQNVTVVHLNPTIQGNVWTTQDLVTELQQELLRHGIRNTGNGTNYVGFGA